MSRRWSRRNLLTLAGGGVVAGLARSAVSTDLRRGVVATATLRSEEVSPARCRQAVANALVAATGAGSAERSLASLFRPSDVVGLKVNCLAGRRLSPRVELVEALVELLAAAGVAAFAVFQARPATAADGVHRRFLESHVRLGAPQHVQFPHGAVAPHHGLEDYRTFETGHSSESSDSAHVAIVEAAVSIDKTIASGSAGPDDGILAGQALTDVLGVEVGEVADLEHVLGDQRAGGGTGHGPDAHRVRIAASRQEPGRGRGGP